MRQLLIILEGEPRGKGRPRFTVRGKGKQQFVQVFTDEQTAQYEREIQLEVFRTIGGQALVDVVTEFKKKTMVEAFQFSNGQPAFTGPVEVEMEIRHPVRASWTKAKRAGALDGSIAPTVKPDPDNVLKIFYDAFNGCVWDDDTQVIKGSFSRCFSESPGVTVIVTALDLRSA